MSTLGTLSARVRSAALGVACALAAIPAAACADAPSTAECEQLLQNLIDIQVRESGGGADLGPEAKEELARQKAAVVEFAKAQEFVKICTQKTPRSVVKCGIDAKTSRDVRDCDQKRKK